MGRACCPHRPLLAFSSAPPYGSVRIWWHVEVVDGERHPRGEQLASGEEGLPCHAALCSARAEFLHLATEGLGSISRVCGPAC